MSKLDKQKERLRSCPSDYTFNEAEGLLIQLGFTESNKGKTSGSRVKFYRASDQASILLHKPHPGNEMKRYATEQLCEELKRMGDL